MCYVHTLLEPGLICGHVQHTGASVMEDGKTKLLMCLLKHQRMQTCRDMKVQIHTFLPLALNGRGQIHTPAI